VAPRFIMVVSSFFIKKAFFEPRFKPRGKAPAAKRLLAGPGRGPRPKASGPAGHGGLPVAFGEAEKAGPPANASAETEKPKGGENNPWPWKKMRPVCGKGSLGPQKA
jgi:hypothetical protein